MAFDPVGFALWLVAFVVSATCHEAGHALVAYLGGDSTAYREGQVSLNPLPHLRREPIGMIVVPLLSYLWQGFMIGWASAPYDPQWAARHPRRAALMAAAGPAANFLLLVAAIGGIHLMVASGAGEAPLRAGFEALVDPRGEDPLIFALARFLSITAMLNGMLMVFNLFPLPPLDGASVIEGFGGATVARVMDGFRRLPAAGLIGLVIAWKLFGLVAPWIFRVILFLAHPFTAYG